MKKLESWVEVPANSDFTIYNIPFGIFKTDYLQSGVGAAIGEYILDLTYLNKNGFFEALDIPLGTFDQPYLNIFIALGKRKTNAVRLRIQELLNKNNKELQDNKIARELGLVPMKEAEMQMPVHVGNYTDFYSSIEHATNVGKMVRDPENALMPNWKHIPVGYHGRASSIIPSGVDIHRPKGQTKAPDAESPSFGPCKRLDFELEMAFITGKETELGDSVTTENAEEHIFGFVLFNDWSARDIQFWEYVPLGPFLGKNFASSISPWVVTLEALEYFKVPTPKQEPKVLPYLEFEGDKNLDVNLEVAIETAEGNETTVCESNYKNLYWNINQQLAHHSINGCNIEIGDMYASGTISGPTKSSFGSMLELSWKGTEPITLNDGSTRTFIEDGDTVIMKGFAEKEGVRVGFGEVRTKVLPAK